MNMTNEEREFLVAAASAGSTAAILALDKEAKRIIESLRTTPIATEISTAAMQPLPTYKCHKLVRAAKIIDVTRPPGNDQPYSLHFGGGQIRYVDQAWVSKHCTSCCTTVFAGLMEGYYVEYDDGGYTSWSPAKAFENGYTFNAGAKP